ncbi:VanW family protein [Actinopolymorpha pittospori]
MFEPDGTRQMADMPPSRPKRQPGRIIALAASGVLLVLVGAYAVLVLSLSDQVPRSTTVAGVQIGGLSYEGAVDRIRDRLLPRAEQPLHLSADGKTHTVRPVDAGLGLDVPATVDSVYQPRTLNPVELVGSLTGGGEVRPVLTVDENALSGALGAFAKDIDRHPSEGAITFAGGTAKATEPAAGHVLDQSAAARRIRSEFLRTSGPIALPTKDQKPRVGRAEVQRAMREFATPAMSGPVTVRVNSKSFQVAPADLGAALTMVGDESGRLAPKLDAAALAKRVSKDLAAVSTKSRDASVKIFGGRPTIFPAVAGQTVPPANLGSAVLAALPKSGDERVATVRTQATQPKVTTKAVQQLGVKQVVGEFTTTYPHADYRNTNIGRAAELIDGTLIKPGGTFSLNGLVGERTAANGFTEGFVIKGGRLREELGGGVSQVATTTYNAGFFAGMDDVEHRPHGFYIDRYPVGREATVYWGSLDLRWRNNTPYGVLVQAVNVPSVSGAKGSITVRLWSTKYWTVKDKTSARYNFREPKAIHDTKAGCVPQDGVRGFDVDITRELYREGKLVKTEKDHVQYQPEDTIVCGEEPPATPPPPPPTPPT